MRSCIAALFLMTSALAIGPAGSYDKELIALAHDEGFEYADSTAIDETLYPPIPLEDLPGSVLEDWEARITQFVRPTLFAVSDFTKARETAVGYKDVFRFERKSPDGVVFVRFVGDYIQFRLADERQQLTVVDSGRTLSLRWQYLPRPSSEMVELPSKAVAKEMVKWHLRTWVRMAADLPDQYVVELHRFGGGWYGKCKLNDSVELKDVERWQKELSVNLDATNINVTIFCRVGTERQRARLGHEKRF